MTKPIEINNTINASIKELNTTLKIIKKKDMNIIIKNEPKLNFIPSLTDNSLSLSIVIIV